MHTNNAQINGIFDGAIPSRIQCDVVYLPFRRCICALNEHLSYFSYDDIFMSSFSLRSFASLHLFSHSTAMEKQAKGKKQRKNRMRDRNIYYMTSKHSFICSAAQRRWHRALHWVGVHFAIAIRISNALSLSHIHAMTLRSHDSSRILLFLSYHL